MRFSSLFLAASAITTAFASGDTIVASLKKINDETADLGSTVSNWSGDIFGALPIVVDSTKVLHAIKKGTTVATESGPLNVTESLQVAGAVQSMAATVNTTITAIIDKHPKFKHLLIAPVVLLNLEIEKEASDKLSDAIIEKVPEPLQAIAKNIAAPIAASFDAGITVFQLNNGI